MNNIKRVNLQKIRKNWQIRKFVSSHVSFTFYHFKAWKS